MTDDTRHGRHAPLLVLLALAVALLLARGEFSLRFLLEKLAVMVAAGGSALAVVLACMGFGALILHEHEKRPATGLTSLERVLFAFGCGAPVVSVLVLAAGLSHHPLLVLPLPLVLAVAGLAGLIRTLLRQHALETTDTGPAVASRANPVLQLLVGAACALLVIAAFAPPLLYDVTEYHLGAYADYARTRRFPSFDAMPHNFYARFPFPIESLYYLGLALEAPRDFAPKLLNALFLGANALLVWAWLARAGVSGSRRLLGVLLCLAHPVMLEVSLDAYIDAPAAFFVCLAAYAMVLPRLATRETATAGNLFGSHVQWAGASGILLGMALATKYTVAQLYLLPFVLLMAGPVLLELWRGKTGTGTAAVPDTGVPDIRKQGGGASPRFSALLTFAVALAFPLMFWLGKNVGFYGNPLEPFFERLFRSGDSEAIAREQFYVQSHYPQSLLGVSYWMTLPLRVKAFGWLLLAPLAGVALVARKPAVLRMLLFCVLAYLSWNLIRESQARFLLPAILLLIVVDMQILEALPRGVPRSLPVAVLALFACANLFAQAMRMDNGWEFGYFARFALKEDPRSGLPEENPRGEFYRRNLGALGEILPAVNVGLPKDARVLLVYEARPYLFERATVYNTVFDDSELLRLVRGACTAAEVAERLTSAGITHVLVNREELWRFIDQYARDEQLQRLGIERPVDVAAFQSIAAPEDLYPPFYRSAEWGTMRAPVIEFLSQCRAKSVATTGRPPRELYLAPVR